MNQIANYWKGQASLAKAYWIVHVVIGMFVGLMIFVFLINYHHLTFIPENIKLLKPSTYAFALPYTVFSTICVWRCAKNAKNKFWKIMAYILTGLSVFSGILALLKVIL